MRRGAKGALDIFELVSEEGTFYDRLFVNMYHRHCSKIAPTGYTLLKTLDGITGTSEQTYRCGKACRKLTPKTFEELIYHDGT